MNIGWGHVTWKGLWKDGWKIFSGQCVIQSPFLGWREPIFKQRTLKVNCLARLIVNQDIRQAASPRGVEIQPCPSEQVLCWLRTWNIMEWAYPTSHARPIHSTRWKVESMPPCCEFVCCQDQRFLPLLHRCVMAVASRVVVLLVDLQLRQQSIPLSFEVPCFAAPTKETERERERDLGWSWMNSWMSLKIYWWVEMVVSWGQKSRPQVSLVVQVQKKLEC